MIPQHSVQSPRQRTPAHSALACYICRKRKIKCGRELPHCRICKETSQECVYPAKALRPGPKIGSTHANSQKRHLESANYGGDPAEERNTRIQEINQPSKIAQCETNNRESISAQRHSPENPIRPTKLLSLSFIIHPCFENCSPDRRDPIHEPDDTDCRYVDTLMVSCNCLGLTLLQLNKLLPLYFEVFTSFQLFRLSELQNKMREIPTANQRTALLAAMLAFGLKDLDHNDVNDMLQEQVLSDSNGVPSIHFRSLGIKYMDMAVSELGDEPLSLSLLQAMILNTHCLLVQGVRGRAWRYLGMCIRSAYELNMHLIDAGKQQGQDQLAKSEQWCIEEEWRRAWWAIWEMDVFASVIRRCPAGIDWTQNETFLPTEDDRWYRGEPQRSCFLELRSVDRWKSLVASQNKSPKAWFIVINSLMKDAQTISSPTSFNQLSVSTQENVITEDPQKQKSAKKSTALKKLDTVLNSLQCTVMALPNALKYRGQYLTFGGIDLQRHGAVAERLAHSSIYSLYLMIQLTKLMIFKYHVFRTGMKWSFGSDPSEGGSHSRDSDSPEPSPDSFGTITKEPQQLVQYFEAAEKIVNIIRCSADNHFKHVNPFLASTAWLAGAVQLLQRSRLTDDCPDRDLIDSNFGLICMTYQKTVDFWNMSKVPLRNWQTLEKFLEDMKENPTRGERFHYEMPYIFTGGQTNHQSSSKRTSYFETPLNANGHYNSADGNFKYVTGDSNVRGNGVPPPALASQNGILGAQQFPYLPSSNNWYAPGYLLDHSQNHQTISVTSSEPDVGAEHLSSFPSTETQVGVSPVFLDTIPFPIDRSVNADFSNYLDQILSGSYLP